jgi:tetratricopeptide (TPR) repeat protein
VHRRRFACALGLAALVAGAARGATPDEAARLRTREQMGEIFASMKLLLPLSMNPGQLAAPEHRAAVTRALEALEAHADTLAAHAASSDPARRYLGDSLAADARHALARYREGRIDSAAFLIQQATENCIACHTKLPSGQDAPVAQQFVSRSALAALPPEERARMLVATRQFDEALDVFETVFATPGIHPATMLGSLTDYLIVSIRVKDDYDRPIPVLEKFARRQDLWMQLRSDVEQWIADLRTLRPLRQAQPSLATARKLVEEANHMDPFPSDHRGLVRYIVASSLLNRFLHGHERPPAEAGEAWYLLGVTELQTGDSFWLSQADFYLETAIRTAPHAPSGRQAYALLEAETLEGYTGSSGVHVPADVSRRLAELRRLVEGP